MEEYERIRRLVKVEGQSIRKAADELGHSRKTIRKALEHAQPPGYRRKQSVRHPVIDEVRPIIDAWLEEDRRRPRKQRHTAQRIFERLRDEYGFKGSSSAVRRYVASRKATQGEVYFPLAFDPGEEAQVDWGEGWVVENGIERKYYFFCMRLCYSGVSFVYAYERMSREALFDGHVRAFAFLGGVPRRLAYDNLKAAVISVGRGRERRLASDFIALQSHYLFQARFCNLASGHEKGHVENLVKWAQRKYLTPVPTVAGRKDLVRLLLRACAKDLERPAPRDPRPRIELLSEERPVMLPLPARPFEACRNETALASKQALVHFEGSDYSVPVAYAHHRCAVKGFVDRVDLFVAERRIARHKRSYEKGQFVLNYRHFIPLLEHKPGGLLNGRPFKGQPWGKAFTTMRRELEYRYSGEGTKRFVKLLLLFAHFPERQVKAAVAECVRRGAFNEEAVYSVLAYRPPLRLGHLDLSSRPDLATVRVPVRPAVVYEALYGKEAAR